MKVCFSCVTTYNIFVSCLLTKLKYKGNYTIIIIPDFIKNCFKVYDKLLEMQLFDEVYLIKTRDEKVFQQVEATNYRRFDVLHYFSWGTDYCNYLLNNLNKQAKVILTDEGFGTYSIEDLLNYWIKHKNLNPNTADLNRFNEVWLFDTRLYTGINVDRKKLRNIGISYKQHKELFDSLCKDLNKLFEYKHEDSNKRVIFFDKFLSGGGLLHECKEKMFLGMIFDTLQNEDILVKKHPSDSEAKYDGFDVTVDKSGSTPWEVIYLNRKIYGEDGKNAVYIAYDSTAVFTPAIIFSDEHIKIILLYRLLGKYCEDQEFIRYLEKCLGKFVDKYIKYYGNQSVFIPKDVREFRKALEINTMESNSKVSDFEIDDFEWKDLCNDIKTRYDLDLTYLSKMRLRLSYLRNRYSDKFIKCVIWGCGNSGLITKELINRTLPNFQVIGFIDTFKRGVFEGVPIYQPKKISNLDYNYIIISTTLGKTEAEDRLLEIGLANVLDFTYGYGI